jgi:hypothetical protein
MEIFLLILIMTIGAACIYVVYLASRVWLLEKMSGISPKVTSETIDEYITHGPNPFGTLSGEKLWKAMSAETWSKALGAKAEEIDGYRSRYKIVLTRHIESLFDEGRFDGQAGKRESASTLLRVPMLRGSVESFLPFAEAQRLYELGFQSATVDPKKRDNIADELDGLVAELFEVCHLAVEKPFSQFLLPVAGNSGTAAEDDDDFGELPDLDDDAAEAASAQTKT